MLRSLLRVLLLLLCAVSPAGAREWTTRDGRELGEGKLLDAGDEWAAIRLEGGRVERVPLGQLSLDDLVYVREALVMAGRRGVISSETPTPVPAPPKPSEAPLAVDSSPGPATTPAPSDSDPFPLTKPNSTAWQVRIDPPAIVWTDADAQRAEGAKLPASIDNGRIAIPDQPSPFVAICSSSDASVWDLWDLRTGERVGAVRGADGNDRHAALSADGKYFVARWKERARNISIWSFETGANLRRIEDEEYENDAHRIMWLADGRLFVAANGSKAPRIHSAKSSVVTELNLTSDDRGYRSDDLWASTPGGHYVAYSRGRGDRIEIYDARNGAMAGDVLAPASDRMRQSLRQLAFSADGQELMAWAYNQARDQSIHLLRWRMDTGQLSSAQKFNLSRADLTALESSSGTTTPGVFTDAAGGWLIRGVRLLDPKVGRNIWSYGRAGRPGQSLILEVIGKQHMLTSVESGGERQLRVERLPLEEIAKSRAIVAAGGTTEDLWLPQISKADVGGVRRRTEFPKSERAYEPAPAAAMPEEFSDQWKFPLMMTDKPTGTVSQVHFPSAWPRRVMLAARLTDSQEASLAEDAPERQAPFRLDMIDLIEGKRRRHWNLRSLRDFLGLSPSGDRALIRSTDDERFDVWDMKTGKHIVGFRPFEQISGNTGASAWGAMVGEDHVLVNNRDGEIDLWSIEPCRLVYSRIADRSSAPEMSGDGRHYALRVSDRVAVVAADVGEIVASLPLGELTNQSVLASLSFSADGRRLAALVTHPIEPSRLVVWDIVQQKATSDVQLPAAATGVSWCAGDVLISGMPLDAISGSPSQPAFNPNQFPNGYPPPYAYQQMAAQQARWGAVRFDLEHAEPVWSYVLENCTLLDGGPGDRTWLLRRFTNGAAGMVTLGARTAEETAQLAAAERPKRVEIRGNDIEVKVDVSPLPEFISRGEQRRDETRRSLAERFRKALDGQAFSTPDAKHLTLKVAMQQRRGEDLAATYPPRGDMRRGDGVLARVSLVDGERTMWTAESWLPLSYQQYGDAPNPQRAASFVSTWDKALDWALSQSPPRDLQSAQALRGFGQSRLTSQGMTITRRWSAGDGPAASAPEVNSSEAPTGGSGEKSTGRGGDAQYPNADGEKSEGEG